MGNVARVTEISARSEKSFDDAMRVGLQLTAVIALVAAVYAAT